MAKLQLGVEVTVEGAKELEGVGDSLRGVTDNLGDVAKDLDAAGDSVSDVGDNLADAVSKVDDADIKVQGLARTFDGVGDSVRGVVDAIGGIGDVASGDITGLGDVIGGLADVGSGIVEGVIPAFQLVKDGALQAAGSVLSSIGSQIAGWVTLGVQSLLHAGKVAAAWLIAMGPIGILGAAVIALVALIILNWENIVAFLQGVFTRISDALGVLGDFITDTWDGILDTLGDVVDGIAGIGKKIWTPISKGFGAAIDVIKGIWNTFVRFWNGIQISVPAVDIPLIGRVGGFTIGLPDLPRLAEGGIVDRPTLALIGERGPEAVVPLDRAGALGGPTINLNVSGDLRADERSLPGTLLRTLYVAGLTD